MELSEKLRKLRKANDLNQADVSEKIGISVKSIYKYENGICKPKQQKTYQKFAELYGVPISFLKNEKEDDFEKMVEYTYGDVGKREADRIVSEVRGLFSGGKLSEADRDGLMKTLQEVYWETKDIQNQREKEEE